jgi:hypothetical protein
MSKKHMLIENLLLKHNSKSGFLYASSKDVFTVTAKEWKLENKQPVGIGSLTLKVKGTIETG